MATIDDGELRITEIALRVLTDTIAAPKPEAPSGRLHECCVCAKKEVWGPNWMWFGSLYDDEKALKTCSRECFEHVCKLEITNASKGRHRRGASRY